MLRQTSRQRVGVVVYFPAAWCESPPFAALLFKGPLCLGVGSCKLPRSCRDGC